MNNLKAYSFLLCMFFTCAASAASNSTVFDDAPVTGTRSSEEIRAEALRILELKYQLRHPMSQRANRHRVTAPEPTRPFIKLREEAHAIGDIELEAELGFMQLLSERREDREHAGRTVRRGPLVFPQD